MLIAALLNFELPSPTVPRWSGAYQWRITGDALDSEMLCVFIFNELIAESFINIVKDGKRLPPYI